MNFELSGRIIETGETKTFSEKFRKREFVIEKTTSTPTNEFTDYIKFQLVNNNCDLLNPYKPGDEVTVSFNIKGNKWEKEGKTSYFTNLDAWRIEGSGSPAQPTDHAADPGPGADDAPPADTDDLPF